MFSLRVTAKICVDHFSKAGLVLAYMCRKPRKTIGPPPKTITWFVIRVGRAWAFLVKTAAGSRKVQASVLRSLDVHYKVAIFEPEQSCDFRAGAAQVYFSY